MKKNPKDEPKVWVTAIKLVIGLVVIVGGVGLVLWYAKDLDNGMPKPPGRNPSSAVANRISRLPAPPCEMSSPATMNSGMARK